jgi:hypothetical protein
VHSGLHLVISLLATPGVRPDLYHWLKMEFDPTELGLPQDFVLTKFADYKG